MALGWDVVSMALLDLALKLLLFLFYLAFLRLSALAAMLQFRAI